MNTHSFFSKGLVLAGIFTLSASGHAQFITGTTNGRNMEDPANYLNNDVNFIFLGTNNQVIQNLAAATYEAGSNVIYTGAFNAKLLAVGDLITGAGIPANTVITAINNAGMVTISAPATADSSGPLTVTQRGDYNVPSRGQFDGVQFSYTTGSDEVTILSGGGAVNSGSHYLFIGAQLGASNGAFGGTDAKVVAINGNVITVDRTATVSGTSNFNIYTMGGPYWGGWNFSGSGGLHTVTADRVVYKNGDQLTGNVVFGNANTLNWKLAPASGTFAFIVDMGWAGEWMQLMISESGYASVLDYQGSAALFNVTPSATTSIFSTSYATGLDRIAANFTGSNISTLTKDGAGSLMLNSTNVVHKLNVSGPVNINNGQLIVASSSVALDGPRIVGAKEYNLNGYGAVLKLDASSFNAGSTSGNLIERDAKINLNAGIFNAWGSTAAASQQVGEVTLKGGRSIIGTAGASGTFTLTMSKITREGDATVNFLFGNATAAPIVVTDDTLSAQLVGGILPWASGQTSGVPSGLVGGSVWNHSYFGGAQFVTVSGGTLRLLDSSEYSDLNTYNINTVAASANVQLQRGETASANSANTVSASKTINSLRVTGWDRYLNFQNGATLTLTSGALMFADTGREYIGRAGDNGALSSGTRALIIQGGIGGGGNCGYINVQITNDLTDHAAAGLILAIRSDGDVELGSTANDYTGYTHVQSGNLKITKYNSFDGQAALIVDKAGQVNISSGGGSTGVLTAVSELRGDGKVNFSTVYNGAVTTPNQLNIGTYFNGFEDLPMLYAVDFTLENPNNNSVNVGTGGVIAPGPLSGSGLGALTIGENVLSVNFLEGSTLALDLAAGGFSDMLEFTNSGTTALNFAPGATIALNFLDGYTPVEGDTWLFATGFNIADSSLPANLDDLTLSGLPSDMEYELLFTAAGLQLSVIAIPEPSTLLLTVSGLALLACLRRRRSTTA